MLDIIKCFHNYCWQKEKHGVKQSQSKIKVITLSFGALILGPFMYIMLMYVPQQTELTKYVQVNKVSAHTKTDETDCHTSDCNRA